jgi:hypothetical protein
MLGCNRVPARDAVPIPPIFAEGRYGHSESRCRAGNGANPAARVLKLLLIVISFVYAQYTYILTRDATALKLYAARYVERVEIL